MSEQVGASMMLGQMLLPAQSGLAGTAAEAAAGRTPGAGASPLDATQAIDLNGESAPVFAALLNEFANLELDSAARIGALNAPIDVRVETAPAPAVSATAGTPLPVPGQSLLPNGTVLPVNPAISGIEPGLPVAPTATSPTGEVGETDSLEADIVMQEPGIGLADDAPPPIIAANARGEASALPAQAVQATPTAAPLPATIAQPPGSDGAASPRVSGDTSATAAVAAGTGKADPGLTEDFSGQGGQRDSGHEPRTAAAELKARPAAIVFSQDGTPASPPASAATAASPAAQATTPGTTGMSASSLLTLQGSPAEWAEPLAQRLAGLATRGANTAEVRLHPPSLGQLEVRITLNNDQASIFLASASPEVREALQQALPRLDSLLSSFGIELADSEIADREQHPFQQNGDESASPSGNGSGDEGDRRRAEPSGLIDAWA